MTALAGSVAQAAAEAVPADGVFGLAWLLVALPLVGAAVLLLVGRRGDRWGHWLGGAAPAASFLVALVLWITMLGLPADERVKGLGLGTWIRAGSFSVDAGLRIDPLSMTFVLLVTFVGTLIHVYSVAYMADDADRRRFFGYLNLFVAAMLLLVLADSYVLLFVGWEGVGLASYLLIGFWNHELPNAVAAKKAFVVNRIGDIGLIAAIMAMAAVFGTTNIGLVGGLADSAGEGWLTFIGLMLLLAACGKSAQFPLQGWLGGAIGYAFAIFHLITHGFFKAGLFLGAGSVMHGMGDQVDMRRFGALARYMKVTWVTMALGWLAIIGVPPFSGYWSKDRIVESAYAVQGGQGWQPWVFGTVALVGVGITAFYMSRLFFMTFHGSRRWDDGSGMVPGGPATGPVRHPHESSALMTWPMIVLAAGSALLGGALAIGGAFTTWLRPVTGAIEHHDPVLPVPATPRATPTTDGSDQ